MVRIITLGIGAVKHYFEDQYTAKSESYYTEEGQRIGRWAGVLALDTFGLKGGVTKEAFDRLITGQDPNTGEQLVQHVVRQSAKDGQELEHRALFDFTTAPHKSVSAAALVGNDDRLVRAHDEAIDEMISAAQEYTQARMGSIERLNTKNLAAAVFTHATSRPVGGLPDPQLHSHVTIFNMTDCGDRIRSVDPDEWFKVQSYLTAVYQSAIAKKARALGYDVAWTKVKNMYAAEIRGYSKEYLDSISRRTDVINKKKEELQIFGAKLDQIVAHSTREKKVDIPVEVLREQHRADSRGFGIDPDAIPNAARERAREFEAVRYGLTPTEIQERLGWALAPKAEQDLPVFREALGRLRDEVSSRLEKVGEDAVDPYYERWVLDHERIEDMPVYEHPQLQAWGWKQKEELIAKFHEWRAGEVETDKRSLAEISGKLAQLENLEDYATRKRLEGKLTIQQRWADPERADAAISFARNKLIDRNAVFDHFEVIREALRFGQGRVSRMEVEAALERQSDRFVKPDDSHTYRKDAPGHRYTTPEMERMERDNIEIVRAGHGWQPISPYLSRDQFRADYQGQLYAGQMRLAYNVLTSPDRIIGVQGGAGVGKTRVLNPVRGILENYGYEVIGVAPTSGAATELRGAGVTNTQTLQRFLALPVDKEAPARVIFVDEASLVSTAQLYKLLTEKLRPQDRALIVGDIRQHQSVEAGRIFEELQMAGMPTYSLNKQLRQEHPQLLEAVKHFNYGRVREGVDVLAEQGWVHEDPSERGRFNAIAEYFLESPGNTKVVIPDNDSREKLNVILRDKLYLGKELGPSQEITVLKPRGADNTPQDFRQAFTYDVGEVIRFQSGNKTLGVAKREYVTVARVDAENNLLTVRKQDGTEVRYDPDSLQQSVQVFVTGRKAFAQGERIQFTQPWHAKKIDNRDLGVITSLDEHGNVRARLDRDNRTVSWNLKEMPHLDYAYAMTSYTIQGSKGDRIAIHVPANDTRMRSMVDKIFANVAVSRAVKEAHFFTDDAAGLVKTLDRVHLKPKALSNEVIREYAKEQRMEMAV